MRAITITVVLTALFLFLGFQITGQPSQKIQKNPGMGTGNTVKRIIVTGPRDRDFIYYTNTYLVTWQCMNIKKPLKILLMSDGGGGTVMQTLAINVPPNQGAFKWVAGKRYGPSDRKLPLNGGHDGYYFRIETMDGSVYGQQDRTRLALSTMRIKVTSPTERPGPEFRLGDDMTIQWIKDEKIKGNVDIELWKNTNDRGRGGTKLLTIARNVPSVPGRHNWRVSLTSGATAITRPINCQIRIRSVIAPLCLWSTWEGRFKLMPTATTRGTIRRQ